MIYNVLSIAGLDPSGGAGVLADIKTFSVLGCYGMAAVTAETVQNTRGVRAVRPVPGDFLAAQIDALFEDVRIDAVKIGMMPTAECVEATADRLRKYRPRFIVLDPVLASSSGDELASAAARRALCDQLAPLASVITPNLDEARRLAGLPSPLAADADVDEAGRILLASGVGAVLIKGGHGGGSECIDVLYRSDGGRRAYAAPRIATDKGHGTGCALSSAIACALARGAPLEEAVGEAKVWIGEALRSADRLSVGHGRGPVHHLWRFDATETDC